MGGDLSAKTAVIAVFFQETLVTAAKFLRNAANRRFFLRITGGCAIVSPPIRRYRRKMFSQNVDPGCFQCLQFKTIGILGILFKNLFD